MIEQLNYEIAGHRILIHTPDAEKTSRLLPTFSSFRCETVNSTDYLFSLTGNHNITVPLAEPVDSLEFEGRYSNVYRTREGVTVSMQINDAIHYFRISPDWREVITDLTLVQLSEALLLKHFMLTVFGMISARHKTVKIHASVTELNGKALIFLGKSGTGKSTHSRLWREFVPGCTLLNDDEPFVRIFDNDPVRVYGAPWSGSTPCYKNESAEVAAIVYLYQNPENKLRKLNKIEALSLLYSSSVMFRSDPDNKNMVFDTVTEIVNRIPFYRLDCRPDREAVMLTRALLP